MKRHFNSFRSFELFRFWANILFSRLSKLSNTNFCRIKSCFSVNIHTRSYNRDSLKFFLLAEHAVKNCVRLTERLDNAAYGRFLLAEIWRSIYRSQ